MVRKNSSGWKKAESPGERRRTPRLNLSGRRREHQDRENDSDNDRTHEGKENPKKEGEEKKDKETEEKEESKEVEEKEESKEVEENGKETDEEKNLPVQSVEQQNGREERHDKKRKRARHFAPMLERKQRQKATRSQTPKPRG